MVIGLTYDSNVGQLKDICNRLTDYINNDDNFFVNDTYKAHIKVEKFNDSSIDILINVFTKLMNGMNI